MKKLVVSVAVLLVLALVVSLRSVAAAPSFQHPQFQADLMGADEVPGPGDIDGSGRAGVAFQADVDVCFTITVSNITLPATAAHIHEGSMGVAGPPVVTLQPPDASGRVESCVQGERAVLDRILAAPADFYVNVHTTDFPEGAVRGQLTELQGAAPADGQATQATAGAAVTAAAGGQATQATPGPAATPAAGDQTAMPTTGLEDSRAPWILGLASLALLGGFAARRATRRYRRVIRIR